MFINLISDTVTKPTPQMLDAMIKAEVGDDVFGEDPTINKLQAYAANLFNKEAALFCPSGTMTNQIAIKVHTQPLDELIADHYSHVYQYETAGYAFNSGVGVNLIQGHYGKITVAQLEAAIKPLYDWLPKSKLVVLENSTNKGGGNYYNLKELQSIKQFCDKQQLKLHLDGARLFNVLVETGEKTEQIGDQFDSVSICLSKGLGAPVGSLLIGDKAFIQEARRFRKVMGGGMRQAGYLAAAGLYALKNNITRLKEDNDVAKEIGLYLASHRLVEQVLPVKTNILIFRLKDLLATEFVEMMKQNAISCSAFGEREVRFVTHLDFTTEMKTRLYEVLEEMN